MEKLLKRYIYILAVSFAVIFISAMGSLGYLQNRITEYTRECFETEATGLISERLQERVNNLIIRVDRYRNMLYREIRDITNLTADIIIRADESLVENRIEICTRNFYKISFGQHMQIILADKSTGKHTLYIGENQRPLTAAEADEYVNRIVNSCTIKQIVQKGDKTVYIFAKDKDIEQMIEKHFHKQIYEVSYGENSYLWVKKVLNKEGGDKYAIDIINPNPVVVEGSYCSTHKKDFAGNLPYLIELEGAVNDGSVKYEYYFPSTVDGKPVKKLAYAQYYEPLDWIVSCGVPLSKIDTLVAAASASYRKVIFRMMSIIVGITVVLFIVIGGYNWWSGRKYRKGLRKYIENETQRDALTGAYSRKFGIELLRNAYRAAQEDSTSSVIMVFDIDNFKKINDTYGHNVGDEVLKGFAAAIMNNIREKDSFIRWGGEEFVLVCSNAGIEEINVIGDKLLAAVRALSFDSDKGRFKISASVGAASFVDADRDYLECLARADKALYESKNSGKDKLTVYLRELDN